MVTSRENKYPVDFSKSNVVLNSANFIVENSSNVQIDYKALEKYARKISLKKVRPWMLDSPADLSHLSKKELLVFIFVYNSLSFSYWGNPDYFFVHEKKKYATSFGLLMALALETKKSKNLLDINFLSTIKDDYLNSVINTDCIFPMFKERCRILRENSKILKNKFNGKIEEVIKLGNRDTGKILNILYKNFPNYRDEAKFKGQRVYFMKKAQILIGDIDRAFSAPIGKLKNTEKLTACADYRLPQLMRHFGILKYSEKLAKIIDSKTIIKEKSDYEIEIRGATIKVNDEIRKILEKKYSKKIKPVDVNDFLWISAKRTENMKPYHLVRTEAY